MRGLYSRGICGLSLILSAACLLLLAPHLSSAQSQGKQIVCEVKDPEACEECIIEPRPAKNPGEQFNSGAGQSNVSGAGASGQGGGMLQQLMQGAQKAYQIYQLVSQFTQGGQTQAVAKPVGQPFTCSGDNCKQAASSSGQGITDIVSTGVQVHCQKEEGSNTWTCFIPKETSSTAKSSRYKLSRNKSFGQKNRALGFSRLLRADADPSAAEKGTEEVECEEVEKEEEEEEKEYDPKLQAVLDEMKQEQLEAKGPNHDGVAENLSNWEKAQLNSPDHDFKAPNSPYNKGEWDQAIDNSFKTNGQAELSGTALQQNRQQFVNDVTNQVLEGKMSSEQAASVFLNAQNFEYERYSLGSTNGSLAQMETRMANTYSLMSDRLNPSEWSQKVTPQNSVVEYFHHAGAPGAANIDQGPNGFCYDCTNISAQYLQTPDKIALDQNRWLTTGELPNGETFIPNHLSGFNEAIEPRNVPTNLTIGNVAIDAVRHGESTPFWGGDPVAAANSSLTAHGVQIGNPNYLSAQTQLNGIISGETTHVSQWTNSHAWSNSGAYYFDSMGNPQVSILSNNSWGEGFETFHAPTLGNYVNLELPRGMGGVGASFGSGAFGGLFSGPTGAGTTNAIGIPAKPGEQNVETRPLTAAEREEFKKACTDFADNNLGGVPFVCIPVFIEPKEKTDTRTEKRRPLSTGRGMGSTTIDGSWKF